MSVVCIPVSLPGLARHAVLLTEHAPEHAHPERASRAEGSFPTALFPRPAHPTPLPSRQQTARLTSLVATLMGHLASVANNRLTLPAKSFRCNTYKKPGRGTLSSPRFDLHLHIMHPRRIFGIFQPSNMLFVTSLRHYSLTSSFPYTLPSSVSCNSFACHSYKNCRGVYQQFPFWNSPRFLCEHSARSASLRYLSSASHPSACGHAIGGTSHPHIRALPLAFSSPMYSIVPAPGGLALPPAARGFQRRHGQRRQQRNQLPGIASGRLPVPQLLRVRPQNYRAQLFVARPLQRFPWHGHFAAHAHPLGLAGTASPVSLQSRQLAGPFCRSHDAPWFVDGFSGADRRAAGRVRKLFPAAANRRARNGFPHAEPSRVLGHRCLAPGPDDHFPDSASPCHHALDHQRRHLLRRVSSQRAQFQCHYHRPPRPRHDSPPIAAHRLGLVHQRHSRRVNFQHSPGGLRLPALRPPLEYALFSLAEFHRQSTARRHRQRCSHRLATSLLVFRASRSLRRHASVLRPDHAFGFHVFPQAGLEGTPCGSGALRRGPFRFLRLGTTHVFQRHESLFAAGFFAPGFFARTARYDPPDQLVRHALERPRSARHRHAFHARLHFAFSVRRAFRNFSRAP